MFVRRRSLITALACTLACAARAAASQCRLAVPDRTKLGYSDGPPSSSTAVFGVSPTATTTGASPSGTSGANASPGDFAYGETPIRGVNLGGWFVLEPWITPSLFENTGNDAIIDEYTFGQMQDKTHALQVLTKHWETWITEQDFIDIAAAGLNHVRIPLGYWSVPIDSSSTNYTTSVDPYLPGAWPHFLRALNWARAHGVRTIVDIHGAPGSQNGFDNSGQRTTDVRWADAGSGNIPRTLDIVRFLMTQAGGLIDVIELINEPAGFRSDAFAAATRQYFLDGYNVVREAAGGGIKVMISDAFLTVSNWQNFLKYPGAQGVMMDYHQYQMFSGKELARSWDEHIAYACTLKPTLVDYANNNIWTVMGEWSNALTDCAKWLNGRGIGARWDGTWYPGSPDAPPAFGSCAGWTGDSSTFSDAYKAFLRKYWEVQIEIGEAAQGWVFWTWKAENADEWSYQKGLAGGWIPKDPTNRLYPNLCSS